jgi:histidinol-phosphate aminotransferase
MSARPVPKSGILDISAYVPGKSAAPEGVKLAKLSSNESPLGPSPKAIEAFSSLASTLALYPDGSSAKLRSAIATRYGLDAQRIICGAGSDEILQMIATTFLAPGDEAIYSQHGFLVYKIIIMGAGAVPVIAPDTDLTANVDAFLERVTERTKVVFLANPNNPTGTYLPFDEVKRLHAGLPKTCLLVLDAAYAEYVRRNDYEAGVELVASSENVIMCRTFSKVYGLAALRIGWAYGPAGVVDAMNRIRGAFNLNAAAIVAGAAAIADVEHIDRAVAHNDVWLPRVAAALSAAGLEVTPSVGNFVLVHFPGTNGKGAPEADAFLTERGIIVRRMDAYGLPRALRITIGTDEENDRVTTALAEFMDL